MSVDDSQKTMSLPEVLTEIADNAGTGELLVVGSWLEGRLWLREGRLVSARVARARTFVDAVFELLLVDDSWIAFEEGVEHLGPGDPTSVPAVLAEAIGRLGEWAAITAVVPSLDSFVVLAEEPPGPVALRPDQWRILGAASAGVTVRRLLELLDSADFTVRRSLAEMVRAGVLSVQEPAARFGRPVIAAPQAASMTRTVLARLRPYRLAETAGLEAVS